MPTVGPGVWEIRIRVEGEFRILLVVRFPEAIYVLHAFTKKSRKTMNHDLRIANRRLRAVLADRTGRNP
jgi:phage-related protein